MTVIFTAWLAAILSLIAIAAFFLWPQMFAVVVPVCGSLLAVLVPLGLLVYFADRFA